MPSGNELSSVESHFKFGENWRSFVDTLSERSIEEAERGLARLFPKGELRGHRFLDIGCGSGLHMLAAQRLGAAEIVGFDLDRVSAQTAQALLSAHASSRNWSVNVRSVFDLDPRRDSAYDVVYSWGVLHHTGDMWSAIRKAAAMVAPGGYLALALYRHTPLCGLWRVERKFMRPPHGSSRRQCACSIKLFICAGSLRPAGVLLPISVITYRRAEWTGHMTFMIGSAAIRMNWSGHRN